MRVTRYSVELCMTLYVIDKLVVNKFQLVLIQPCSHMSWLGFECRYFTPDGSYNTAQYYYSINQLHLLQCQKRKPVLVDGPVDLMFNSYVFYSEFFYIQMEKYARQALADGVKSVNELVVTTDAEIYRVLILHYNRNNQIEVRRSPCLLCACWM